jgi:hypothetical protein
MKNTRQFNFRRPDIMKGGNARRWAEYEDLRDKLVAIHQRHFTAGERTPRNIWLFATHRNERFRMFRPPDFRYPKSFERWLLQAIRRCKAALEHPESLPGHENPVMVEQKKSGNLELTEARKPRTFPLDI